MKVKENVSKRVIQISGMMPKICIAQPLHFCARLPGEDGDTSNTFEGVLKSKARMKEDALIWLDEFCSSWIQEFRR